MVKIIILLFLTIASSFFLLNFRAAPKKPGVDLSAEKTLTAPESKKDPPQKLERINLKNSRENSYTIIIRKVTEKETVALIPNFSEGYKSEEVLNSSGCDFITGGGFYTKDSKPLGLFYTDGKLWGPNLNNPLLNGYLFLTMDRKLKIGRAEPLPLKNLEFALQSGPYFSATDAASADFEETKARRALVAETYRDAILFLTIFETDDNFTGPPLGSLPELIALLNRNSNLQIKAALNLDGGTSLTFLQRGDTSITEIKKVGSFLCVK